MTYPLITTLFFAVFLVSLPYIPNTYPPLTHIQYPLTPRIIVGTAHRWLTPFITLLFFAVFLVHSNHLVGERIDYGYNMRANLAIG